MKIEEAVESPEERKLHRATDRALKKYRHACEPAEKKLNKVLRAAWRQHDKDIAPFQEVCDQEIATASRAYTKATQIPGETEEQLTFQREYTANPGRHGELEELQGELVKRKEAK